MTTYTVTICNDFKIQKSGAMSANGYQFIGTDFTTAPATLNGQFLIMGDTVCNDCGSTIDIFKFNGISVMISIPDGQCRTIIMQTGAGDMSDWSGLFCVHEDTLIKANGKYIPIKDIRKGDIVESSDGKDVEVLNNIKLLNPTKNFIKISKNTFGVNIPFEDVYITKGHPILLNTKEVQPYDLIGESNGNISETQINNLANVYTILTNERTHILTSGIYVATWDPKGWNNASNRSPFEYL